MKQKLDWYYIIWNIHEDRPEYSSGNSSTYFNMYEKFKIAKQVRGRWAKNINKAYTRKNFEEWINKEIERTKERLENLKNGKVPTWKDMRPEEEVKRWIEEAIERNNEDLKKNIEESEWTDEKLLYMRRRYEIWRINIETGKRELCMDADGNILKDDK